MRNDSMKVLNVVGAHFQSEQISIEHLPGDPLRIARYSGRLNFIVRKMLDCASQFLRVSALT